MANYRYSGPEMYRPLSPWAYFGYSLLFSIPIVGFILLIVFSFNDNNINRRNFARSFFCMFLVALIIAIIFGILYAVLGSQFIASLRGSMRPYY